MKTTFTPWSGMKASESFRGASQTLTPEIGAACDCKLREVLFITVLLASGCLGYLSFEMLDNLSAEKFIGRL